MLLLIEGAVLCFILLLVCVVGIANGPVGLVCLYEKDVQDRAVELGLITRENIRKNSVIASLAMLVPMAILVPVMVYSINGATGFWDAFWQIAVLLWIMGLFDRLFIDWFWVERTKAWLIPGTEDLIPYIPGKTKMIKWFGTIVFYPILAAILAAVFSLFL